eukprot:7696403-Alexandrium_andersonii.AAC.1
MGGGSGAAPLGGGGSRRDSVRGCCSRPPAPGQRLSTSSGSCATASPRTGPRGRLPRAWLPPGGASLVVVRLPGPPRRLWSSRASLSGKAGR